MMIKNFTIAVILSLVSCIAFTQSKETIDRLQQKLSLAKTDKDRVDVFVDLCASYRLGNSDSSLFYGQKGLELSQQIKYPKGEVLCLSFMGVTMRGMGNLPKGLEMSFKAIQIGKENKVEEFTAPALNAVGEIYTTLKDYPKAMNYLLQQVYISDGSNSLEGLAYGLRDIAVIFEETNQLDSAAYYTQESIATFHKLNREEPMTYEIFGDIKLKSGNHKEALSFYQKSLQVAIQTHELRASSTASIKIASLYKSDNQPDSAIYYANKGLEDARFISQKKTIMDAADLLSALFEEKDAKQSLRYLKIANAYKDSLFGAGNLQSIQVLVNQQEEHQKEIEVSRTTYQNNLKLYALFAGLGILLLVAGILYRNNRQKQKANIVLHAALSDLKSTQSQLIQSEKMASLGELTAGIAHEIQNPLNFVTNFSEVSNELVEELKAEKSKPKNERDDRLEEDLMNDISQNLEKINHHGKRADAIVKGMLLHSRSSSGAKEPTDINALCDEYLRLSYHGLRAKDNSFNATIKTDFDKSIANINVIPQDMGRVILNLLTNAFYVVNEKKQQNLSGYEPTIIISTKKLNNKVEIRVSDNGNGIPQKVLDKIFQPFFTTKPTGQGTGLGLSLSYDIITKGHGGELKAETKENEGSIFIIQLPIING
jgi:signal transduction histidine kinase